MSKFRKRLDEPISWEQKRRLIEVLIAGIRVDTVENFGVKQSEITVTYRFSEPGQEMSLTLPQAYASARVVRIPTQPITIGDHLRLRRLTLKLRQEDVADQLCVEKSSVRNLEINRSNPDICYMPAIIRFLGYNPLPPAETIAEQLVRQHTTLGLTQKESARRLGVDQGTLARWERGEREPLGRFLDLVKQFLKDVEAPLAEARRAG